MLTNTAPLTVYKASAGSGKTFTLAVEYIKLLVSDPQNYRYTLAVTFTNKATQEMKQRILSKLYGIANSLPDAEDYFNKVKEAFPQLSEKVIRNRAADALTMLVHDYNAFRVETIDSFFQRVLRNLARELGLTANLQVMLNDYEVESQAVDNIIENINTENDPLLGWIMDFINERMTDDKSWNVISQIKEFGKNIFSDFYKDHQDKLHNLMDDAATFKKYTSSLRALKGKADKTMKDFADRYATIAAHAGLTDQCYSHGHSNAPGYFENLANGHYLGDIPKMPNSYILKGMADHEALVKKADINWPESQVIINEVGPLLEEAEAARKQAALTTVSVLLTLQNINQLRLLGRIEQEVNNINAANNDYPLSNTQKLLNSLIDKSDSPFIYEKIGGQLRYIMIDEFQDTSTIQWENFKVLLDDCIAHQNGSLIVGDVKQSIYRWRDGDWTLLQGLTPENYPNKVKVENLDTNYRSQPNIVNFNNAFFSKAAELTATASFADLSEKKVKDSILHEALQIKHAYEDVRQKTPPAKPKAGLVSISLLPKDSYEELMVTKVKATVEMLLSKGIPEKKIAIIVRKNKHIKFLADYFLHNDITVNGRSFKVNMVSDEAFRLDASLAVCVIVKAMVLLTNPADKLTEAFLAKAYASIRCREQGRELSEADLFLSDKGVSAALPVELTADRAKLLSKPLIDLAEELYAIFHLKTLNNESAYVCAFFDQLSNFLQKHIAGIDEFIEEWDESLCAKSIHSDEIDGIRLLTVHKSKGLEFDNVIMPYCDWQIEDRRDILWVEPAQAPYNELAVVPVNINPKKLLMSIYAEDYESEHLKSLVDNLNVLYVAFTRASRNLFVIGKKDSSDYPSMTIQTVLPELSELHMEEDEDDDGVATYHFGTLSPSKVSPKTDEADKELEPNVFLQESTGVNITIDDTTSKAKFKQSNDSTDFITPDDEQEDKARIEEYIQTGNILHQLFATIHDYTDVDAAIDQLEFDGILYNHPMTRPQLKAFIQKKLAIPQIHEWFSPRWTVMNECSIIYYDTEHDRIDKRRPDRVIYDGKEMIVIDFKTGRQNEEHKRQVGRYVSLLQQMGYAHVKGYLWYIRHDDIIEV